MKYSEFVRQHYHSVGGDRKTKFARIAALWRKQKGRGLVGYGLQETSQGAGLVEASQGAGVRRRRSRKMKKGRGIVGDVVGSLSHLLPF